MASKMILTEKSVRYSPGERRLLALLSDKPISSEELSKKFYRDDQTPFHGRKIIIGLISSIQKKAEANKEAFSVMKSDRKGPHPIEVWVKKRK